MYFWARGIASVIIGIILVSHVCFAAAKDEAVELNEKGIALLSEGKYEDAIDAFTKALVYAPSSRNIKGNLAYAFNVLASKLIYERNGEKLEKAIDFFKRASELAPEEEAYKMSLSTALTKKAKGLLDERRLDEAWEIVVDALKQNQQNVDAWVILGDICFYSQRLVEAKGHWQKALSMDPSSQVVLKRLNDLSLSYDLEKDFKELHKEHFILTYESRLERMDIYDIEAMLNDAYREVGQNFDFFPEGKIVVILYDGKTFQAHINPPKWATGLYDGKIRLPVSIENEFDKYKGLVYHEYTHAVIHMISQKNCPDWLNEGLASYEEDRFYKRPVDSLKGHFQHGSIIEIPDLDKAIRDYERPDLVNLAYDESLYVVKYIVAGYGWERIRAMVKKFIVEQDNKSVIEEIFNTSFDKFQDSCFNYIKEALLQ